MKIYSVNIRIIFLYLLVCFIIIHYIFIELAHAIVTSNDTYILQVDDSLLPNQVAKPAVKSINDSITISLDGSQVEFDPLTPTNPLIRSRNLAISTKGGNGYSALIYLGKPLTSGSGSIIQNTSCDDGACTDSYSSPWTSSLTYGFGFRCEITNTCKLSFPYENSFSSLPIYPMNRLIDIKYDYNVSNSLIKLIFKLNTSGSQVPGNYSSQVHYLIMPNI